jgi:hypothetical protein
MNVERSEEEPASMERVEAGRFLDGGLSVRVGEAPEDGLAIALAGLEAERLSGCCERIRCAEDRAKGQRPTDLAIVLHEVLRDAGVGRSVLARCATRARRAA